MSVVHDVDSGLVPPVEHDDHQYMPELVTGTKIVQLACEDRKQTTVIISSIFNLFLD